MNILKSKLLLVGLLSCNVVNATPREDAVFNISLFTAVTMISAAMNYTVTTFLVTEEFLVVTDYPTAQSWYDAMALKYPEALLDQKLFLQTMRGQDAKYMSWCSTFNQIYFPQESLEEIETAYQKKLDGEILTDEEILALGKQEFILLHESGHIEHNDRTYA